ncbi:MAG: tRNA pseudouridine(38-40) synthase TruA [Halioglobus sp.]|nr:tRNA pseudouridine(38-40) synthase TruA [Halioglobus sp.]
MSSGYFSPQIIPGGTRIACRVEYDGSAYNGWQSQSGGNVTTVQDALQSALAAVAGTSVRLHCAGRTDTGVHAHAQFVHFDAPAPRSSKAWVVGGNANLPEDIRLHWARAVPAEFHARHSARSRLYRYVVSNTPVRPALLRDKVTWHRPELNAADMHEAAQALVGEQDFSAFRAASCQSASPMRNVHRVAVSRRRDLVVVEIEANAFLHHMVRNIAGTLLAIGEGRAPVAWLRELLRAGDRTLSAETAPARGLYLADVGYPHEFGLPATPPGPIFAVGDP